LIQINPIYLSVSAENVFVEWNPSYDNLEEEIVGEDEDEIDD
jgi:hypothetical protein